jgi:hypothetical protein
MVCFTEGATATQHRSPRWHSRAVPPAAILVPINAPNPHPHPPRAVRACRCSMWGGWAHVPFVPLSATMYRWPQAPTGLMAVEWP